LILLLIVFFVIGLIAIMLEAVLPYGISAAFGFALIAISGYLAYMEFGVTLAILYCLIALTTAVLVTRLVMRSGLNWMTLPPPKAGEPRAAPAPTPAVEPRPGDIARVVAPLRPTGTIDVGGRRVAARCEQPELEFAAGARVRLIERDSIYWVVEGAEGSAGDGESPVSEPS
jgi:membrane-bound ClpP family serine protease